MREIGSEFDWTADLAFETEEPNATHPLCDEGLWLFRSGRDALKALARQYSATHGKVLMPALCCESMVSPFEQNGYTVSYYGLREDYRAKSDEVARLLDENTILVYLSYFGIPPFSDGELAAMKQAHPKAVFLEDRTQNALHRIPKGEFVPDGVVTSLRKWFALPDGGLLWCPDMDQGAKETDEIFSALRQRAMEQKSVYLQSGEPTLKEEFRGLLGEASERLDQFAKPFAMTEASKERMRHMDYDGMLSARVENVRTLCRELTARSSDGQLEWITQQPENSTLYLPILVRDRDRIQRALAEKGIYCPVIWPLPEGAHGVCPVAERTAEQMLALPCDQRYGTEDMVYVARCLSALL